MKLSYSIRGWQDLSWAEHFELSKEMGFSGFELSYQGDEMEAILKAPNASEYRQALLRRLNELNLTIPCITVGRNFGDILVREEVMARAVDCLRLAGMMKIPYVHLRADKYGYSLDEDSMVAALKQLIPYAEKNNVIFLVFQYA